MTPDKDRRIDRDHVSPEDARGADAVAAHRHWNCDRKAVAA